MVGGWEAIVSEGNHESHVLSSLARCSGLLDGLRPATPHAAASGRANHG